MNIIQAYQSMTLSQSLTVLIAGFYTLVSLLAYVGHKVSK